MEWAEHWQCGKEVQDQKKEPWRNEELKKLEEGMLRLEESDPAKEAKTHKAKMGVGSNGFDPKVPLDLTRETGGEVVEWPQQSCTTMFFLIPKNVTSEGPIALMPTMIRWEALRAPEVAQWQCKYRIEWDATDGRNGGAERTVWEWTDVNTRQEQKVEER